MLRPTDDELHWLRVYHPWFSRIRGATSRFADEGELVSVIVEEIESQLILRRRTSLELAGLKSEARQALVYARFVRQAAESEFVDVPEIRPYLDRVDDRVNNGPEIVALVRYSELVTQYELEDLDSVIESGRTAFAELQRMIVQLSERITAMNQESEETARQVNQARHERGLHPERFTSLDDSEAAEG